MSISFSLPVEWNLWRVLCFGVMVILLSGTGCNHTSGTAHENTGKDVSPVNASFRINGREIALINGYAEVTAAPGSASKITTRVWGKPQFSDLTGDGQQDAALILIHNTGGSGTFYYVVASLREGNHYRGTTGVLLGDRIEPKGIGIVDNRITVTFSCRSDGEAFTTPPSVPMEQLVIYDSDTQQLTQVARDFEGEADPARMTLQMKTWFWENTNYNDDTVHTPDKPEAFSLTFEEGGKLLVTTDCNSMRGHYSTADNKIQIEKMISTRMYCEGSQEQLFSGMLESVGSYFFTNRGQLVLELKYDSGSMIFW